jgi:hypothetical protein
MTLEAAFVGLEILSALNYVHSKKLVMIGSQPLLSISDFTLLLIAALVVSVTERMYLLSVQEVCCCEC